MFERLVSVSLGRFTECSRVLPTTQFAYRKDLGICDALLCVSHTLQSAPESRQEARVLQIDFSAAFDRVNNQEFSIGSVLWVLEVLCFHSPYQQMEAMTNSSRTQEPYEFTTTYEGTLHS